MHRQFGHIALWDIVYLCGALGHSVILWKICILSPVYLLLAEITVDIVRREIQSFQCNEGEKVPRTDFARHESLANGNLFGLKVTSV